MSQSVFCQAAFPRKAVIDNDTVCILSIEQTKVINKVFVDRDECNEMKDSLNSELTNYGDLVQVQKQVIASQDKEIDIHKKIISEKDVIIESDSKLLKKQNRQVQWLKIQRTVLGGIAISLTGIIVYQKIQE